MHTAILLAASALAIDYGWQPLDGGGFEYIIQIEPELLDSLRAGETLRSDLPAFLKDVRSYRILCGRDPVPRLGNPRAAAPPVERQPFEPTPATPREEPAESTTRGNFWSPTKPEETMPPMHAPRNEPRYGDFRTEASPPKSQTNERPGPVNEDPPRPFLPDPESTALVQQTSGFHGPEGSHEKHHDHDAANSAKGARAEDAAKPWWPLTATLLGLFVSMGGNAYLGLQWWATRTRCLELLRGGRGPASRKPLAKPQREPDVQQEYSDAPPGEEEEPEDDEDQDVRAISEEELTPQKRRR